MTNKRLQHGALFDQHLALRKVRRAIVSASASFSSSVSEEQRIASSSRRVVLRCGRRVRRLGGTVAVAGRRGDESTEPAALAWR